MEVFNSRSKNRFMRRHCCFSRSPIGTMLPLVLCKPAARNQVSPLADFLPVDPLLLEAGLG
jgi:hypothetical protein